MRLAAAGLLLAPVARAQDRVPAPVLPPEAPIRVESAGLGRVEGRFERYAGDTLILRGADGTRTGIPVSAISTVRVRGHATKTGAIVGGVTGALATGFLAGALCGLAHNEDGIVGNEGFDGGCAAVGAGVGALAGGGIGAGIGALILKWRVRYWATR
jgi:hypothetical protein